MSQEDVIIHIGGREFEVACQDGEKQFLMSAAKMLDTEASVLVGQIGRMPEARMLLMSGLMLADKTAGLEEKLREAEDRIAGLEADLNEAQNTPPERVEVPVIPDTVTDGLAEIAARAESLADSIEEKTAN